MVAAGVSTSTATQAYEMPTIFPFPQSCAPKAIPPADQGYFGQFERPSECLSCFLFVTATISDALRVRLPGAKD